MKAFMFFGMSSDFGFHWLILFLIVPLIFRWVWDAHEIIVEEKEPDHTKHSWVTFGLMLIFSLIVWRGGPAQYYIQPLVLSAGIFNQFFDYGLNKIRGLAWNYIDQGEGDKKSSRTDRLYKMLGWKIVFGLKLWCSLVAFSTYFYMSCITHGCF